VDQGAVSTTGTHHVRLLLIFFGAVLGFLALSFVFGSSSASADDGAPADPLGSVVAETLSAVAAAPDAPAATSVTAIATPATTVVDSTVTSLLGDAAGDAPVTSIIVPVTALADTALAQIQDAAGPLLTPVTGTLGAVIAPATELVSDAATASVAAASAPVPVLGIAAGILGAPDSGGLEHPDATGATTASGALTATSTAFALFALLLFGRRSLTSAAVPGSPVYDTDSSPD
jgi:hypothetical protein